MGKGKHPHVGIIPEMGELPRAIPAIEEFSGFSQVEHRPENGYALIDSSHIREAKFFAEDQDPLSGLNCLMLGWEW